MSEKSKGDTSRQATTAATTMTTNVVKNPLLSASVTGLTLDDFPNKPLLLPPVATSRETKSLVTVGSSASDIDSEALDEINLNTTSEDLPAPPQIDLNANPFWDQQNTQTDSILSQAASSLSALPSVASSVLSTFSKRIYSGSTSRERTPDTGAGDANANYSPQSDIQPPYLQQSPQAGQFYEHNQPQSQHSSPYYYPPASAGDGFAEHLSAAGTFAQQQQHQHQSTNTLDDSVPPPEPPKFYTPAEVPALPSASATGAPPVTGQNTYRLSAKKKTYAPIPGFSEQSTVAAAAPPTFDPAATTAPLQFAPPPPQPTSYGYPQSSAFDQSPPQPEYYTPPSSKPDERKGLFSLTNLVPTGVLQNISGLVQSAAGSFAQSQPKPTDPLPPGSYDYPIVYSQPAESHSGGYFGAQPRDQPAGVAVPPPPLFYPPPTETAHQPPSAFSGNPAAAAPPFGAPLQQLPSGLAAFLPPGISSTPPAAPATASAASSFHTPPATQPILPPPTAGFIAAPPKGATPESIVKSPVEQKESTPASVTPIPFFNPAQLPSVQPSPAAANFFNSPLTVSSAQQVQAPKSTPIDSQKAATPQTAAAVFGSVNVLSPSVGSTADLLKSTTPPTTTSTNTTYAPPVGTFYNPTQPLSATSTPPPASVGDVQLTPIAGESPPPPRPTVGATAPPPSTAGQAQPPPPVAGKTSFRLQKGTRLYKNPLTTAETAPPYNSPATLLQPQTSQAPFNPFASPVVASGERTATPDFLHNSNTASLVAPPLPPAPAPVANYFIPFSSEPQSVALFTPELPPSESNENLRKISSTNIFNTFEEITNLNVATGGKEDIKNDQSEEQLPSPSPVFSIGAESTPATDSVSAASLFEQQTIEPIVPEIIDDSASVQATLAPQAEQPDTLDKALEKLAPPTASPTVPPTAPLTAPPTAPLTAPPKAPPITQPIAPPPAEPSQVASFSAPPPLAAPTSGSHEDHTNPYRRGSSGIAAHSSTATASLILANFFNPVATDNTGSGDFNFFAAPAPHTFEQAVVPPPTAVVPPQAAVVTPPPAAATTSHTSSTNAAQRTPTVAGFFAVGAPQIDPFKQPTNRTTQAEFPALPPLAGIAPPPLAQEATAPDFEQPIDPSIGIAPPLGFDNIIAKTSVGSSTTPFSSVFEPIVTSSATSVENSFSSFFNPSPNEPIRPAETKPRQRLNSTSFFDTFAVPNQTTDSIGGTVPPISVLGAPQPALEQEEQQTQQQQFAQANEDQRIQNFFNNPPPKENGAEGVGDLNYDLVHCGLGIKHQPLRSLTPISNLVEPPSSSCSEFSELSNVARVVPAESTANKASEQNTREAANINDTETATSEGNTTTTQVALDDFAQEKHYEDLPAEVLQELRMAHLQSAEKMSSAETSHSSVTYAPAVKHWFFKRPTCSATKYVWMPFSHYDSALLETTLAMGDDAPNTVGVEGGRYDVMIRERVKLPVYWEGQPIEVRRCSWFYKGTDSKYVPYEETIADLLEVEYKQAAESGEWHKKIMLSMGEQVVFHAPSVIVHFQHQQSADAWGGTSQPTTRPRVVKRDLDDFSIDQGEAQRVDHLLFMVHGIGSACDLKMRSVEEVVDEFRSIAQQLVLSHYKNSCDMGTVGRVEVLPISWHSHLHSEELGIDEKLKSITLESIPKLRNFTNDTLLDVLFYTSPTFCQKIMTTVAASMNDVYTKYRERNQDFNGGVSLAGHSLGSLILFDLLCHQKPVKESDEQNSENPDQGNQNSDENEAMHISYTMGPAGTGQPFIHYTQLAFQPKKFFALGSPIGMFVTIRGIDKLGLDFRLPTCPGFYNIFHPFDPVAYRIEALVNPDMSGIRPVLIPHHKGRKRMHLELKETMTRVGADLKQRFFDTFKNTLDSMSFLGTLSRNKKEAEETMKNEVDKVIAMQIELERQTSQHLLQPVQEEEQEQVQQAGTLSPERVRARADSNSTVHSDSDMVEVNFPMGKLNDSKRIDHVLQEAPLEFFNEYIFALSSHVCYWESEDTILFVMKEIYSGLGITPDSQVPQQTMTIERPSSRNNSLMSSPTT